MTPNIQAILARCIDDGLETALINSDIPHNLLDDLRDKAVHEIWLEIDSYFTFPSTYE